MAVVITGSYLGNLKTELIHSDSGVKINTTAPKDNQGDGNGFSPTDLIAAALGSCMLTLMGIAAKRLKIDISGSTLYIEKIMSSDMPRRITNLKAKINLTNEVSLQDRKSLEQAALNCPVHKSLSDQIKVEVDFIYD